MSLDENQTWYVRAAVRRGIAAVEDLITEGEEYLAGDDVPPTFREATRNMIGYHQQMLDEMRKYIPEELQS